MLPATLLVAPIAPGARTRRVVLPPGKWYDFYTGDLAGEHETISVTPPLERIPLFVRDGGLVPLIPARQFAPGRDDVSPLEVRYYGSKPGSMRLYDDDGETFDYERGERTWTRLAATKDSTGRWQGTVTPDSNGKGWRYSQVRWTFMSARQMPSPP